MAEGAPKPLTCWSKRLVCSGCADRSCSRYSKSKHDGIVNVSMIRSLSDSIGVNFFLACARDILKSDLLTFMAKLFDLPRYIAVEGPIRVGKSTLSNILAERLNAQRVTDPEHNSFLAPFYQGEPGAAFQAQFTFLVQRFDQLRDLDLGARSQKLVVSDL